MSTFYYAVCVKGNSWTPTGYKEIEPLRVEGEEPMGLDPVWCCDQLRNAFDWQNSWMMQSHPWVQDIRVMLRLAQGEAPIRFCPFCGEEIILTHHLDVEVIEMPAVRVTTINKYGIASASAFRQ